MIKKNTNANPAASKAKKSIPPVPLRGTASSVGFGDRDCGLWHPARLFAIASWYSAWLRATATARNDKEKSEAEQAGKSTQPGSQGRLDRPQLVPPLV